MRRSAALRATTMTDLFDAAPPSNKARVRSTAAMSTRERPTRVSVVERFSISELRSPRAHRCFRCGVFTALGFGLLHRDEKIVFACKEHFGDLG